VHDQSEAVAGIAALATSDEGSAAGAYPDELNRWTLFLGIPMLAACVCIGLAFGTRFHWFYAGAIAFGPGLGILAIIYLAISSDTNGETSLHELADSSEHLGPAPAGVATTAAAA
jgi:hypothetical protein